MKLNLPEQNTPTATSTPSNPRKLKKLLSVLPNSNMGELTKQTFQILRDLNRQTMPSKHRLENLEMLRVPAHEIFNNLKKYFINRTLPLPEKSQKIVNLNQSLLQELVYGYEIIAYESANKIDTKINDKTLSTSICRAINYLSEMLLHCCEVYELCPKNLWHDTHQLYLFAESKNLVDNIVIDKQREIEKTTIANSYKQILLFTLAQPITLRQSDSDRVFKELFKWSQYANIQRETPTSLIGSVFCMRVNEDTAPHYLNENDLAEDVIIRTLDTSKLVSHVESLIAEQSEQQQKFAVGDTIPLETLKTLVSSWGKSPKRQFSRAERQGHINVAIGLSNICKAIQDSSKKEIPDNSGYGFFKTPAVSEENSIDSRHDFFQTSETSEKDQNFTLSSITTDDGKCQQEGMAHIELGNTEDNMWDMVGKGRILTNTYEKDKQLINEDQLELRKQNADSHWEMVNISAGGYCLRWNSDHTSKAQIGELIALQEFYADNNFKWNIGAIRWMQFTRKNDLEIGVKILSTEVVTATAQRANRLDETPFACLMLPDIKALEQTSSTILPSYAFKTNNKLVVQILENKLNITLGETTEHTGSFTQFAYINTELDPRIKKAEATKNKDDFDELWSSL